MAGLEGDHWAIYGFRERRAVADQTIPSPRANHPVSPTRPRGRAAALIVTTAAAATPAAATVARPWTRPVPWPWIVRASVPANVHFVYAVGNLIQSRPVVPKTALIRSYAGLKAGSAIRPGGTGTSKNTDRQCEEYRDA